MWIKKQSLEVLKHIRKLENSKYGDSNDLEGDE